jgi:phage-related protein
MPSIGSRCHELRINDESATWRIIYRLDADAIVILEVFSKKSRATPKAVINVCKRRLKDYEDAQAKTKTAAREGLEDGDRQGFFGSF